MGILSKQLSLTIKLRIFSFSHVNVTTGLCEEMNVFVTAHGMTALQRLSPFIMMYCSFLTCSAWKPL